MSCSIRFSVFLICYLSCLIPNALNASDFGGRGLIKLPSARMAEDGHLWATFSREEVADIYNVSFQGTPWLEGTVRYSVFNPRNIRGSLDIRRDRSYEAKVKLFDEGSWSPQVALGVRDILGTGIWEAEYAVASKKVGPLDLTIGMGWGRLAERGSFDNPLSSIDEGFADRPAEAGGSFGGESRSSSYFRGNAAWFGGVRLQVSRWPLQLLLEYNSDDYSRETELKTISDPSPLNFSLEWSPKQNFNVAASWLHGSSIGIRVSGALDTKSIPRRKRGRSFYSSAESRSLSGAPENLDLNAWYDRTLYDAERSGLRLNKAWIGNEEDSVALVIENSRYAITADAVHKALAIAEVHLPRSVKSIEVMLREDGHLAPTLAYQRQGRSIADGSISEVGPTSARFSERPITVVKNKRLESPSNLTIYRYPSLLLGGDLSARTQLMDPDAPFAKQVYAKLSARMSLASNLDLWVLYGQDVYNDFTNKRASNSVIQRVRSDINRYLTEGESGLDQLFLEHRATIGQSFHLRSYAGILEGMYAGVGNEILYEPFARRWALGTTINLLKQRGFKKNFELLDYQTVTGYVSLYYASPWYNFDFAIHAGKYLARDRGATFETRRTFDNGFSVGAFFTRTNVPAEQFGEGSFDKGLFFRLPFNGLFPGNTKNALALILRPLDRDGGRRLEDFSGSLWFSRRDVRYDALSNNLVRMLP